MRETVPILPKALPDGTYPAASLGFRHGLATYFLSPYSSLTVSRR